MKKYREVIDLRCRYYCPKLFSRLVCQKLYDIYSAGGGDLSHLDNLLCDLYSLERDFKTETAFTLYWHYQRDYTSMRSFRDTDDDEVYKISYLPDSDEVVIEGMNR